MSNCNDYPTPGMANTFRLDAITENERVTLEQDRTNPASDGKTKKTMWGIENDATLQRDEIEQLADNQRDQFDATFTAQFQYVHIGNISDYVGDTLTDTEKLNSYQYPDDSGEWYGPIQSQTFPITIPADPTVTGSGWSLVNAASQKWVSDGFIVRANTVADMVAGYPVSPAVGQKWITYEYNAPVTSEWGIVDELGVDSHYVMLSNGLYAKLIIGDSVDPIHFGAFNSIDVETGVAQGYSDLPFSEAQSVAKLTKKPVKHSSGIYRLGSDYILKRKTTGSGKESVMILFDDGYGFRTYENDLTRYFVPEISGITFSSDKEYKWNATDAGEAYVSGITNYLTRLSYGQRVAKGNKTTTPNNVLSDDPVEQQNGSGFWNKDYSQWMQSDGVEPDISSTPLDYTSDSNSMFSFGLAKTITNCNFSGFTHGLVLSGVIEQNVTLCDFKTCRVGLYTRDASFIGGTSGARVTTTGISRNVFEDVDIGIYAHTLLQSTIDGGNVFQPAIIGIYVSSGGTPGLKVSENYFEVGHTFLYHLPNLGMQGEISNNFTNQSYTRYLVWANDGKKLNIKNPQGEQQKVHFNAGVDLSNVSSDFILDVSSSFFRVNGNIIDNGKVKECIIRTVGTGSSFTIIKEWSSVDTLDGVGIFPIMSPSQSGIAFQGSARVVSIELMSSPAINSYFNADATSPEANKVYYFYDVSSDSQLNLRDSGVTRTIKILWNEY